MTPFLHLQAFLSQTWMRATFYIISRKVEDPRGMISHNITALLSRMHLDRWCVSQSEVRPKFLMEYSCNALHHAYTYIPRCRLRHTQFGIRVDITASRRRGTHCNAQIPHPPNQCFALHTLAGMLYRKNIEITSVYS